MSLAKMFMTRNKMFMSLAKKFLLLKLSPGCIVKARFTQQGELESGIQQRRVVREYKIFCVNALGEIIQSWHLFSKIVKN